MQHSQTQAMDFLRIIECPICYEPLKKPIRQCENGHNFCNDCVKLLENCSFCKGKFTNIRNYLAEEIIEHYWKMQNQPVVVKKSPQNPKLDCFFPDCKEVCLTRRCLYQHVFKKHEKAIVTTQSGYCSIQFSFPNKNQSIYKQTVILYDKNVFIFITYAVEESVYISMRILRNAGNSRKYLYRISQNIGVNSVNNYTDSNSLKDYKFNIPKNNFVTGRQKKAVIALYIY